MQMTTPENVGFSSARLDRITGMLQRYVDEGKLAGMVALVARHGEVAYQQCVGQMDVATEKPMQRDALFRIFSMTKPIASVALMMLYEEGRFHLTDPVSRFIPGFTDVKVYAGEDELADLDRDIAIHHLLSHTSGLGYGLEEADPIDLFYREANILRADETLADKMDRLVELPLAFQPGTAWRYSVAVDVIGRLIEVIAGMPLDVFLQQRIFEPLGMVDTAFYTPVDKKARLATLYGLGKEIKLTDLSGEEMDWMAKDYAPKFLSGGGGLVSTTADYARFCQMMLNRGELDGERLLGRKTVELMTTNHLPAGMHPTNDAGGGFGLGFRILTDLAQSRILGSVGAYSWGGAASTSFWIDPQEDLFGVLMLQLMFNQDYPIGQDFRVLTYQALVD